MMMHFRCEDIVISAPHDNVAKTPHIGPHTPSHYEKGLFDKREIRVAIMHRPIHTFVICERVFRVPSIAHMRNRSLRNVHRERVSMCTLVSRNIY